MNKLRIQLLLTALLALPVVGLGAHLWVPAGTAIDSSNGITSYAIEENKVSNKYGSDVINGARSNDPSGNSSVFATTDEGDAANTLDIYGTIDYDPTGTLCPLKIDGDVTLSTAELTRALTSNGDLTVNIETPVIIEPLWDAIIPDGALDAEGNPFQQANEGNSIIFEAFTGHKITVNVKHDITFRGLTDPETNEHADLFLVFKGDGQTIFKMDGGVVIKFDGQVDEYSPVELDPATGLLIPNADGEYYAQAGGTKVFVLMDQTKEQVDAGQNKLVFERHDTDLTKDLRTMLYVGPNSVFTYLSDNYEGVDGKVSQPYGDDLFISSNFDEGGKYYGAVAIDPSNPLGTGRMVLFIKGAYKTGWQTGELTGGENPDPEYLKLIRKFPFNDGSLVIAGHYVTDLTNPEAFRNAVDYSLDEEDQVGFDFSSPAGVKAIFRILDNKTYASDAASYAFDLEKSRGLLVVNDCQSLGKYAADTYWDSYNLQLLAGAQWAALNNVAKNVRTGCVLGVNGVIDIYDGAFLDYVAGAANSQDYLAAYDYEHDYLKKRNSSALIIDGFDQAMLEYDYPFFAARQSLMKQQATHAQIILRGEHARVMFKSAATASSGYLVRETPATGFGPGYMINLWARDRMYPEYFDPISDASLDWNTALAVGGFQEGLLQKSTYDGYRLKHITDKSGYWNYTTSGQGEIVLDVEAPLSVQQVAKETIPVDPYKADAGYRVYDADITNDVLHPFSLSSLLTDHAGREINIDNQTDYYNYETSFVTRPLAINSAAYARYNSAAIMLNDHVSFFNTKFVHNDVTKHVFMAPDQSEPAVVGGERLHFSTAYYPSDADRASDRARYRYPEIRLFNSELSLRESLCMSGVRVVVMDREGYPYNMILGGISGSNESVIRFYDHGQSVDAGVTGYGRVLMMGSELNLMGIDQEYPNEVTQSAFINIFKRNFPQKISSDDNSSYARLAIRNGNEFAADIAPAAYEKQRSQHYICFGIPNAPTSAVRTGMFIGWPTTGMIETLLGATPLPCADDRAYPYTGEALIDDTEDTDDLDLKVNHWFYLNSLNSASNDYAPRAEVVFEGNGLCMNAKDSSGHGPLLPVKDANDCGNVYVDFGGKLSVIKYQNNVTRVGDYLYNNVGFESTIATRQWNDYDLDGIVKLTDYSGVVDLPHNQVQFKGGYGVQPFGFEQLLFVTNPGAKGLVRLGTCEEMNVGWFYRDPSMLQMEKKAGALTRPDYLLYVGAGSDVQQLRVSGGTPSDPFYIDITGDGERPLVARVREFATLFSTRPHKFIGEGQHGIIMAEFGGRFGLGSSEWNANSLNAWNVLGKDFVTLAPLGHCTVDVNEDVIIADDLPFMPMERRDGSEWGFGYFSDEDIANDPNNKLSHRMTFFSKVEREVRVLKGTVLDLTGFGRGNRRQEIAFGGKIKLVFEEGSGICFPDASEITDEMGGVVLYFNDDSQCVFEGMNEATLARYDDAVDANKNRIKLMGKGQIWLNKNARLNVMGTASVGVQSGDHTLHTDITISAQRQSQINIGDATVSGGTFQVGNVVDMGADATVNFSLAINGANASFTLDREGFFGIGAGIINKLTSNPNGDAASANNPQLTNQKATVVNDLPVFNPDLTNAWQVMPLFNVNKVTFSIQNGTFNHRNIANGSSNNASLMAIGPVAHGWVRLNNAAGAIVCGGGNIAHIPAVLQDGASYIAVNVWDYAEDMPTGEQYSILASAPSIRNSVHAAGAPSVFAGAGLQFDFASSQDLFDILRYYPIPEQVGSRFVSLGATQFANAVAYINQAQAANDIYNVTVDGENRRFAKIYRIDDPVAVDGRVKDALPAGALSIDANTDANPVNYALREVVL